MVNLITKMKLDAPLLSRVLLVWLVVEFCVAFILPMLLPSRWYFELYLSDEAVVNTEKFLQGEGFLKPDAVVGWINQQQLSENNWRTDQFGARTTAAYEVDRNGLPRVLFAGSSMVNGGHLATNEETISGFLTTPQLEVFNFGTMLYEMDQVLLYYRDQLQQFQPDLLVVGINPDPISGLKNLYIPLRRPKEIYMPYLKPRFKAKVNGPQLLSVDPQWLSPLPNDQLLALLHQHDDYYGGFQRFQRHHFTPLSRSVDYLQRQYARLAKLWQENDSKEERLLEQLMEMLVKEASSKGTRVVFLAMPDASQYKGGWKQRLHDGYAERVERLNAKFSVIDVRQLFRDSGLHQRALFQADRVHYQAAANQLIADALRQSEMTCRILHSCHISVARDKN
ncbi:SGNH/GDSL hydrolase family protein [Corallincola spongiicola]|uniref:SGNH/GDSL hydrolase family protein n=1 Tax=Corallincola spongiicola TaxID=2520508 RepID=A0ABY1WQE6_9GAMM|nr:SGNH/GDSL hydrolase family protein [Corallincola spongiicola]TAA46789.1 SGNH/GDSL hydrolase family protein [Corallincola spongiicola]